MKLHTKITIGLILGVIVGVAANLVNAATGNHVFVDAIVVTKPLGTAFIRAITMIVIPLVVASLLVGVASLGDLRTLGRFAGKTMAYYMTTTAIAVSIGLGVANLVKPGGRIAPESRAQLLADYASQMEGSIALAAEKPALTDLLLDLIPTNPIRAAADGDMLALIVFTLVFGAAASMLREERRRPFLEFFEAVNQIAMIVIGWVMKTAPYAVFVLLAAVSAEFGFDILRSLVLYTVTVIAGLLLHATLTYSTAVRLLGRVSPLYFFRRIREAQILGFSTSSSNATLPVTLAVAEKELGVSNRVASFVLPLGATINMDGTALYQGVAVVFIAQVFGIDLNWIAQLTVVLTATLASVGAAGVPSAGIITLVVVLQQAGVPETGIALILGVDRILDMLRTSVNITGDLSAATCIARTENELVETEATSLA